MLRSSTPSLLLALSLGATASLAHGQEVAANNREDAYVPTEQTLVKSAGANTYVRLGAAFGAEATDVTAGGDFESSTTGSRILLDAMGAIPVSKQFELSAGAYISRSEGSIESGSQDGVDYSGSYSLSEFGLALAPTVKVNANQFGAILRLPLSSNGEFELDLSMKGFAATIPLNMDLSVDGPELGLFYRYAIANNVALGVELDGLLEQRHKMKGDEIKDDGSYARRSLVFSSQFMF
jgi:hypothetical protein